MKSNPYDNFTQAIDSMVLSEKPMQDRVLDAYTKHISRVEAENIPQKVQYLYHSFQRCMEPRLNEPEARQIAKVILFIAEEIKKNQQTTDK
jgi:hypothetical protein